MLRTGFRLDASGNVLRADGALTTQKFRVTGLPDVNATAVASAWAANDAAGQPMGTASTRDTLTASIGTATVWIDYGRPAKRGREIWGKLVAYDTTWRGGALYPSATRSWLIVNKQTGQWGTACDRSQDVARIPVDPAHEHRQHGGAILHLPAWRPAHDALGSRRVRCAGPRGERGATRVV